MKSTDGEGCILWAVFCCCWVGSNPVCLIELHYSVVFRVHSSSWVSFCLGFSFFREAWLYIVMSTSVVCLFFCGAGQKFGSRFTEIFVFQCSCTCLFMSKPIPRYLGLEYTLGGFKAVFVFNTSRLGFCGDWGICSFRDLSLTWCILWSHRLNLGSIPCSQAHWTSFLPVLLRLFPVPLNKVLT